MESCDLPEDSASLSHRPTSAHLTSSHRRARSNIMPGDYVSTILVNNIHCASCVAYVQEILSQLGPDIHTIDISILTHQVTIHHNQKLSALEICRVLAEHAFEVHSISTEDWKGKNITEYDIPFEHNDGLLEHATEIWRIASSRPQSCGGTFESAKRKQHLENCKACQVEECIQSEKTAQPATPSPSWARKSIHVPQDVKLQSTKGPYPEASHARTPPINDDGDFVVSIRPPEKEAKLKDEAMEDGALHQATISIGGMTCASCSGSVTKALEKLDFVRSVNVNLLTNSASVTFEGLKAKINDIIQEIEDLGYEASVNRVEPIEHKKSLTHRSPRTASFHHMAVLSIGGMTCASCSGSVTRGLKDLPFVHKVEVSLVSNSATIEFEGKDNINKLKEEVEDLGFDCDIVSSSPLLSPSSYDTEVETREREISIKIDGMFCGHCPSKVIEAIKKVLPANASIIRNPSQKSPIITVLYKPMPPSLTARTFVSAIEHENDIFKASIYSPPNIEERSQRMQRHERLRLMLRLILCFLIAVPTFLIGIVWMSLVPKSDHLRVFFMKPMWTGRVSRAEWALFILATPVMFFAADVFHVRALKEIKSIWRRGSQVPVLRRFYRFGSMNLLISAGTSVAYISSLAVLIVEALSTGMPSEHITTYFDSVVFLTFFILIGRYLEAYSKAKTGDAVTMLGNLRPSEAFLVSPTDDSGQSSCINEKIDVNVTPQGNRIQKTAVELLEVGDSVSVPHGVSPPADGIIIGNEDVVGEFNESSLTGESRSVVKRPGDKVFSGSINIGKPVIMKITDIGGTSMLDQIVAIVREGQTKRAPVERIADILTSYFVPVITLIAVSTFIIWVALGESGSLPQSWLDVDQGGWVFWSLKFAIATFVVACPCGIGLAAPTALFVGSGLAAKYGILVRGGGEAFQEASNINVVVFDKTGTLTEGKSLKVTDYQLILSEDKANMAWALAKALEEESSHPIAKAIISFCSSKPLCQVHGADVKEKAGSGLQGVFEVNISASKASFEAAIGNESLMSSLNINIDDYFNANTLTTWKTEGKSVALLAIRNLDSSISKWILAAIFATADPIRKESRYTVQSLQEAGIEVYMLSGDNQTTATAVGQSLGIPSSNIIAGVLPTQKAEKVEWLQNNALQSSNNRSHRTRAIVAFVGDGINDAPALTTADVSCAIGSGSDVALFSASFILLTSNLTTLLTLISLSKTVFRRIKFNFLWALVYNVCLVPIAAGVIYPAQGHPRLDPVWASAAMAASSVSVVCSSLVLRLKIPGLGFRAAKSN
ncbi:MAG: hypothetical protein M1834_000703 [Cirrosporium novae-zelandiae]|nr:MAG: hypothetical protein M1834_000703 [Cirrosporium novae-zelandiae]